VRAQGRIVIAPEDGESVSLGALDVVHRISWRDTGGAFSVGEHSMESGTLGCFLTRT
jgi:hypothetical protein